jgi:hypothetical protein
MCVTSDVRCRIRDSAQPEPAQNLSRLEPFVHGLGKAILRELMDTPPAAQPAPVREPRGYQWLDTSVFRKKLPENAEPDAWNALYTTPPAQPAVPEGWKLAPIKPTLQMINALADTDPERESAWDAVLAATPKKDQP